jgi:hypothetical protein
MSFIPVNSSGKALRAREIEKAFQRGGFGMAQDPSGKALRVNKRFQRI